VRRDRRGLGAGTAANPDYAERVAAHVERLAGADYRATEKQVAHKRLTWLEKRGHSKPLGWPLPAEPVTPRQAFDLFFLDYLGFAPKDVPVVEESDSRITWLSQNPCPTLEACSRLGLDTRTVCRSIYEKPTQLFLSRLDPRLRFVRDYTMIRPYAPHCRESIVRVDLERFMREAIAGAWATKAQGNKGYGAALVMGDRVIARAYDTISTDADPSQHGELRAIRQAASALGTPDLCGALLLSTCEPCPMCAGLAIWANVTTIVYGSSIIDTAAMGRTRIMVGAAEIAERSPFTLEVIGGLLKEECDRLYV
jgi:tRNA(Arg) A34 adenosine deaminase TadA